MADEKLINEAQPDCRCRANRRGNEHDYYLCPYYGAIVMSSEQDVATVEAINRHFPTDRFTTDERSRCYNAINEAVANLRTWLEAAESLVAAMREALEHARHHWHIDCEKCKSATALLSNSAAAAQAHDAKVLNDAAKVVEDSAMGFPGLCACWAAGWLRARAAALAPTPKEGSQPESAPKFEPHLPIVVNDGAAPVDVEAAPAADSQKMDELKCDLMNNLRNNAINDIKRRRAGFTQRVSPAADSTENNAADYNRPIDKSVEYAELRRDATTTSLTAVSCGVQDHDKPQEWESRCITCGSAICICNRVPKLAAPAVPQGPPVPMQLHCPNCGAVHIDEGEWATRPHKTHQCQSCKHEWRPFEYATVGVYAVPQGPSAEEIARKCRYAPTLSEAVRMVRKALTLTASSGREAALQQWKREATECLAEWDKVREFLQANPIPGEWGGTWQAAVLKRLAKLQIVREGLKRLAFYPTATRDEIATLLGQLEGEGR